MLYPIHALWYRRDGAFSVSRELLFKKRKTLYKSQQRYRKSKYWKSACKNKNVNYSLPWWGKLKDFSEIYAGTILCYLFKLCVMLNLQVDIDTGRVLLDE